MGERISEEELIILGMLLTKYIFYKEVSPEDTVFVFQQRITNEVRVLQGVNNG